MVMPGQFLERPTLVDVGGLCLEALWHRGPCRPALLILAPHPRFGGGSMDAPLCLELAFAATRRGHPTLRFNWRGVCASQGEMGGVREAVDDARQAFGALRANVCHDEIVVAGYGFGAEVACALARDGLARHGLILVAPLGDGCSTAGLDDLKTDVRLILPGAHRRRAPEMSERLERASAPNLEVEIVPEADSAFREGLVQVGEALARHLASMGARAGRKDRENMSP